MVDLPKKKVGIVACSGEELPEGTVTRLAALRVLEKLRPDHTVTICLPLFLAGGEGDRAFARFYPTIAIDGCGLRCAARATEIYSGKPASSLVVSELVRENNLQPPGGTRRLDAAGNQVVELTAQQIIEMVDNLLGSPWNRRVIEPGVPVSSENLIPVQEVQATCSCGSGIPVQKVTVSGNVVTIAGLPLIFQQFRDAGKAASDTVRRELYDTVKIYNPIPDGEADAYANAILDEYALFCEKETS